MWQMWQMLRNRFVLLMLIKTSIIYNHSYIVIIPNVRQKQQNLTHVTLTTVWPKLDTQIQSLSLGLWNFYDYYYYPEWVDPLKIPHLLDNKKRDEFNPDFAAWGILAFFPPCLNIICKWLNLNIKEGEFFMKK